MSPLLRPKPQFLVMVHVPVLDPQSPKPLAVFNFWQKVLSEFVIECSGSSNSDVRQGMKSASQRMSPEFTISGLDTRCVSLHVWCVFKAHVGLLASGPEV